MLTQQLRDTLHLVHTSTIIQFGDWNRKGFEFMAKKYFSSDLGTALLKSTSGDGESSVADERTKLDKLN